MRTITDIALQKYGSIDFVGRVAYENNISINDDTPLEVIADNDGIGDQTIKDYYRLEEIIPSNNKVKYYDLSLNTDTVGSNYGIYISMYDNAEAEIYKNGLNKIILQSGNIYEESLNGLNNTISISVDPLKVETLTFVKSGTLYLSVISDKINLTLFENMTDLIIGLGYVESVILPKFKKPVKRVSIHDCNLKSIDLSCIKSFDSSLGTIRLENNNMSSEGVNNALISLTKTNYVNTYEIRIDGTNAAPTGDGLTAKTLLQSRGWTVTTN